MTTAELLALGRRRLSHEPAGSLEAEMLLSLALDVGRSWLYANAEAPIGRPEAASFVALLERRERGEPLAYITGRREFWSLSLKVTSAVLIPRPETELLVEVALAFIPMAANWRVADLGTGSGALALAIASERPRCEVHATELSGDAISVARINARRLGLDRIRFHEGPWLEPLEGAFDCIVSNPPYVSSSDPHLEQGDCRYEPHEALSPGEDAMAAIRQIAADARSRLRPGGMLAFEHGADQGQECRELLGSLGYVSVATSRDLAGLERVTNGLRAC